MLAVSSNQEENIIMDDRTTFEELYKSLNKFEAKPPNKVRIVTKRGRRSSQFAEVSQVNTELVDKLAELAEKLADNGNGAAAKEIIQIIRTLLTNNNKLQQVVSEALQDIPG